MLNIADIPRILEAFNKVPPELVLKRLTYWNSLIFETKYHNIEDDWYYFGEKKAIDWSPIYLPDPSRNPMEFIDNNLDIKSVRHYPLHDFRPEAKFSKKTKYATFFYKNDKESIELIGKDFAQFRSAKNYFKDEDFTIEYYNKDNHLTTDIVFEVRKLIEGWKLRKEEIKEDVNYEPFDIITNLFNYGQMIDYLTTIVRYKGEILHYETSERIHQNYVILIDIKPSFSVSDEVSAKFKYTSRLVHWIHMKHWDDLYTGDRVNPIYYNIGYGFWDDFKNRLRPFAAVPDTITKLDRVVVKEVSVSNELF